MLSASVPEVVRYLSLAKRTRNYLTHIRSKSSDSFLLTVLLILEDLLVHQLQPLGSLREGDPVSRHGEPVANSLQLTVLIVTLEIVEHVCVVDESIDITVEKRGMHVRL